MPPAPGVYTLTLGLFGPDIPSKEEIVTVKIGATVGDIQIS